MNHWLWPLEEGYPDKDDLVAQDPIASLEWTRIVGDLAARRMLSPAWGGLILVCAATFSDLKRIEAVMAAHGRSEEWAARHAGLLAEYRLACRELMVHPDSSMTTRRGR
jgi:hypothetical protein